MRDDDVIGTLTNYIHFRSPPFHFRPTSASARRKFSLLFSHFSSITHMQLNVHNAQTNGNAKNAGALVLPGTFKSMVHPNVTGDIAITLAGCHSLSELLHDKLDDCNSSPNAKSCAGFKNDEVYAKIQFNYRLPSGDASTLSAPAQPVAVWNNASPPPPPPPGLLLGGGNNSDGVDAPTRRYACKCRGKISVSQKLNTEQDSDLNNNNNAGVMVKQYDMMFIQQDFELGQQFMALTFSKTLVVQPDGHHHSSSEHQQHEKGLMLSGHYTCLRQHDMGTVRVYVPASALIDASLPQPLPVQPKARRVSNVSRSATNGDENHHQNNTATSKMRCCYGCGESGHLHKDCPKDQLFCYNCNHAGHSSKNCKKPKPWESPVTEQQSFSQVASGGAVVGRRPPSGSFSHSPSPPTTPQPTNTAPTQHQLHQNQLHQQQPQVAQHQQLQHQPLPAAARSPLLLRSLSHIPADPWANGEPAPLLHNRQRSASFLSSTSADYSPPSLLYSSGGSASYSEGGYLMSTIAESPPSLSPLCTQLNTLHLHNKPPHSPLMEVPPHSPLLFQHHAQHQLYNSNNSFQQHQQNLQRKKSSSFDGTPSFNAAAPAWHLHQHN